MLTEGPIQNYEILPAELMRWTDETFEPRDCGNAVPCLERSKKLIVERRACMLSVEQAAKVQHAVVLQLSVEKEVHSHA